MAQKHYARVRDPGAFVAPSPEDLVMVARTFAFWQSSARIHGTVMWGRPDEADVAAMSACWDLHIGSTHGTDPTLTDIRALEAVDLLAFERLLRTFVEKNARWTKLAGPQAIVHGGGIASATVLGALQLTASDYTLRAFVDADEALAWLGRPALAAEYDALRCELLDAPEIVRRVRAALDADDRPESTGDLARHLGLSVRSLQRHLADVGTTLRAVRVEHVVARIERLLEGTELDLGAIASSVGVGSASRLVTLFRESRGMTPGEFRSERGQTAVERPKPSSTDDDPP